MRQTTDGAVLHAQLEQGNRLRADIRKAVDRAFIAFVHALLRRYSRNPGRDPATGVRAILILQRIVPYLGPAPPEAAGSVKGLEQQVASILWSARNLAATGTPNGRAPEGRSQMRQRTGDNGGGDHEAGRSRLADLHAELGQNLDRALTEAIDFVAHTKTAQLALHQADDASEVAMHRHILSDCITELVHDLDRLTGYLRSAEGRARELRLLDSRFVEEAARQRDPTLTDELTGIPNRTALLHRLRAEAGRAQRYGIPLALAIIDPDRLDDIGDPADAAAAAEVVRCYAQEILANFRAYDMVARCGGDGEFAVLLPNAGREQAVAALRKAGLRVPTVSFKLRGRLLSAPTFSSGLAWYLPGECPEDLLQRAAQALRRAKSGGINRIETALPRA
ncbi:MAG: GGDEF domain-containing protein [Gammaproteobacteria bacterium]|nr:GGDEF domain-containing protein [Gammaproteobacteria bacterium]